MELFCINRLPDISPYFKWVFDISHYINSGHIITLFIEIISTLFGGLLAYYFGIKHYFSLKDEENFHKLTSLITYFAYIEGEIYNLQSQFLYKREGEANRILYKLESKYGVKEYTSNLKSLLFFINNFQFVDEHFGLDLAFIAKAEPNFYLLLVRNLNSAKNLQLMLSELNTFIDAKIKSGEVIKHFTNQYSIESISFFSYLSQQTLAVCEQANSCRYFMRKSIENLIKYGHKYYGKEMKINEAGLKSDIFLVSEPIKKKEWEKDDFFRKKEPGFKKTFSHNRKTAG